MNWKKQLKELELELDGCKCYHEATEAFIEDLLQEVGEKCVGEGDVCNEEMFVTEDNGIEHDNGAKFFSNGWNFNRDKVKSTLQKYGVVIK